MESLCWVQPYRFNDRIISALIEKFRHSFGCGQRTRVQKVIHLFRMKLNPFSGSQRRVRLDHRCYFQAWFKNGSFWVTKSWQIQPLSDDGLQDKCIKIKSTCQALWNNSKPNNSSQWGCTCPVIDWFGLLPTRSGQRLRIKVRWFKKKRNRSR